MKAMMKERRTSDSIKARPRIIGVWTLFAAPGLRAIPSRAEEAARPRPNSDDPPPRSARLSLGRKGRKAQKANGKTNREKNKE